MKPRRLSQYRQGNLRIALATVMLPVLLLTGYARAQDIHMYPAKGQSQAGVDPVSWTVAEWGK